jgi:hypothetical protein
MQAGLRGSELVLQKNLRPLVRLSDTSGSPTGREQQLHYKQQLNPEALGTVGIGCQINLQLACTGSGAQNDELLHGRFGV